MAFVGRPPKPSHDSGRPIGKLYDRQVSVVESSRAESSGTGKERCEEALGGRAGEGQRASNMIHRVA